MDWEAEGLLEGLEDEESRKARAELLDHLHDEEGCSVDELRQAVEEDRLVLLPVERLLAGDKTYSQRQIAEEVGLELDQLREFRRALGLAVPDPDAEVLGEADLEGAKDTAAIAAAGFSTEETLEVTRVLGRGHGALRRGAAGAVRPDVPRAGRLRARSRAPDGERR